MTILYNDLGKSLVDEQKEKALQILKKLEIIDPEVLICGGAPRNWDQGKLANDVDTYINCTSVQLIRFLETVCDIKESDIEMPLMENNEYARMQEDWIMNATIDGIEFQFHKHNMAGKVFCKSIFNTFDFGINKIAIRSDGSFIKTHDYSFDVSSKTLTMNKSTVMSSLERDRLSYIFNVRIPKMKEYYPDSEFIIVDDLFLTIEDDPFGDSEISLRELPKPKT